MSSNATHWAPTNVTRPLLNYSVKAIQAGGETALMADVDTVLMAAVSILQAIMWLMTRFWMPALQCANVPSVSCERLDKAPELAAWVPGL